MTPDGIPIYTPGLGWSFSLVVEGKPGASWKPVGGDVYNYSPDDPTMRPDLQVEVNQSLGNGSTVVCDNAFPAMGGIPEIKPPDFSVTQPISDALNDLGCRFLDGSGNPGGRGSVDACTLFSDGTFHFADSHSVLQFCAQIAKPFRFLVGDTVVSVRLRDTAGNTGPLAQMIIHVNG